MTRKEKTSVSPMLEDWHDFYVLLGTAAAALVALLFVAASIGASVLTPGRSRATRTYVSPIVFHYAAILFASLIALVPTQTPLWLGISMGSVAIIGLLYSLFVCFHLIRDHVADIADLLGYGGCPAAAYAMALISAFLFKNQSAAAVNVAAGAFMVLLVVNIRNAWDLLTALARMSNEQRGKSG
jgi:hypothetical protein